MKQLTRVEVAGRHFEQMLQRLEQLNEQRDVDDERLRQALWDAIQGYQPYIYVVTDKQ